MRIRNLNENFNSDRTVERARTPQPTITGTKRSRDEISNAVNTTRGNKRPSLEI